MQNSKRKAAVAALKETLREKKAKLKKYEKEVEEYEKTKKRQVEPKKYKTKTTPATSTSEDDATVCFDIFKSAFVL